MLHEGLVSVSPLSFDLSSRTDHAQLRAALDELLAHPAPHGD
jgi:hypothetical protein